MALVSQESSLIFAPTVLETVLMGRYPYLKRFQLEGTRITVWPRRPWTGRR